MNAEAKELFRKAVLRVLDSNRSRYGLGVVAIGHQLMPFGFSARNFDSTEAFSNAIADALQYLGDKKFLEEVGKAISQENRAWRITGAGIAYLDEQG